MNKKQVCIVVPIYKLQLIEYEIHSVQQCIRILSNYSIYFIAPIGLDVSYYKNLFKEVKGFMYFDKIFFKDLKGYNSLLLDAGFYNRFNNYKYMLVHQTDSYVFKDELLNWVDKGYDYIGGVLFEGYVKSPELGVGLWCAGNGGLSLRRIDKFSSILASKKKLKNWRQLMHEKKNIGIVKGFKAFKYNMLFIFKAFGYKNNVSFYAKNFDNNEDVFFIKLSLDYNLLSMPNINKALLFSWDRCPDFLFKKLKKLPFGCHAWYRNDGPYEGNKEFWSKKIK